MNVALPTLSRYFAVPAAPVSGVVTAYLVALAVAMPASGWVGDRCGARSVLLGSIGLFTAASALCGMATSLHKRAGPRRLMVAGMCGTVVTIGGMAFAGPGDAAWLIPVLMYFTGCSSGFAMAPSQTASLATVSAALTGQASMLLNTLRQAGERPAARTASPKRSRKPREAARPCPLR